MKSHVETAMTTLLALRHNPYSGNFKEGSPSDFQARLPAVPMDLAYQRTRFPHERLEASLYLRIIFPNL